MWTETNTEQQLIEGVIKHGPEILELCQTSDDLTKYLDRISKEHLNYPVPKTTDPTHWFIPKKYQDLDIESWIWSKVDPENEIIVFRVTEEISLFKKNNMMPVLKTMKYIVDTLRENKVVWGVGRGSSVASYVLYLIGVHKIDSIKYKLPIEEFFKGEING